MRFEVEDSILGQFKTLIIKDNKTNNKIEIAQRGATLLNYFVAINKKLFNIIDGFRTPEELECGKGARCWIMAPFANRIEDGIYNFLGKTYYLKPIPPRTQVIHGLTSNVNFTIQNINSSNDQIEIIFYTDILRPGIFDGYPFNVDIYIKYVFEGLKLNVEVIAKNVGNEPTPFGTGWHPYFKTSEKGIDNLILTINANQLIITDKNLMPLKNEKTYGRIDDYPDCDFRETKNIEARMIKNRILDNCFADLKVNDIGLHSTSIQDPTNGMKISVFQKGGMTLVFSGDTLSERKRRSIAIEPVQFMTNAFNRPELVDKIKIASCGESKFEFGVEVSYEGK